MYSKQEVNQNLELMLKLKCSGALCKANDSFFFYGGRGLNPEPCISYALSIPTELSSRGPKQMTDEASFL
jgi:hypothetical protein